MSGKRVAASSLGEVRDRIRRVACRHGVAVARRAAWSSLVPALRFRARRRLGSIAHGQISVVTVNWNSRPYLETLVTAVRRFSPRAVRIVVVDNGSSDGSRELRGSTRGLQWINLPLNLGHDLALDVGFLSAATEYVVALDVDAFPLHDRWLDELLTPLSQGYEISGARLNRNYVHPCCLAMRLERFVTRKHSFRARYRHRAPGRDASGEVAEEMASRERGRLYFFDVTSRRGPGDVGSVFGDILYHNFYATRFRADPRPALEGVSVKDADGAWVEAIERYGLSPKEA